MLRWQCCVTGEIAFESAPGLPRLGQLSAALILANLYSLDLRRCGRDPESLLRSERKEIKTYRPQSQPAVIPLNSNISSALVPRSPSSTRVAVTTLSPVRRLPSGEQPAPFPFQAGFSSSPPPRPRPIPSFPALPDAPNLVPSPTYHCKSPPLLLPASLPPPSASPALQCPHDPESPLARVDRHVVSPTRLASSTYASSRCCMLLTVSAYRTLFPAYFSFQEFHVSILRPLITVDV